jgi:competence ComEA-like helix-hairpin-helix protein
MNYSAIKKVFSDFFITSKVLQTSYLTFVILVVIYEIFISFNPEILVEIAPLNTTEFEEEIAHFQKNLKKKDEKYQQTNVQADLEKFKNVKFFNFNPNLATEKEFLSLGLTQKQVRSILNYRNKGGKFKVKDDFSKIYTLPQEEFQLLRPYIDLPENLEKNKEKLTEELIEIELFNFDPNTATENDLMRLGLSSKQILTIQNYLSKGGKFKAKEDFKKMYVISQEQYQQLEPYIVISAVSSQTNSKPEQVTYEKTIFYADLNISSEEELIKIAGIGKFSAKKIIEYRNQLGGFIKIEQLMEVNGMFENNFIKAKPFLTIDLTKVKKINLNLADFTELIKHPYLEKEDVDKILKYRNKKGKFTHLEQLVEKEILPQTLFLKLKPYLKL